jgi:hypothetical protein
MALQSDGRHSTIQRARRLRDVAGATAKSRKGRLAALLGVRGAATVKAATATCPKPMSVVANNDKDRERLFDSISQKPRFAGTFWLPCKPRCRFAWSSERWPILGTHVRLQANANDTSDRRRRPDDRLRHARRVRARARWENSAELRDAHPSPGPDSLLGAAAARWRSSLRPGLQSLQILGPLGAASAGPGRPGRGLGGGPGRALTQPLGWRPGELSPLAGMALAVEAVRALPGPPHGPKSRTAQAPGHRGALTIKNAEQDSAFPAPKTPPHRHMTARDGRPGALMPDARSRAVRPPIAAEAEPVVPPPPASHAQHRPPPALRPSTPAPHPPEATPWLTRGRARAGPERLLLRGPPAPKAPALKLLSRGVE